MTILVDQNIWTHLPAAIHHLAPGSRLVPTVGYDRAIRDYGRDHGFIVLSRDADCTDLS